MATPVLELHDVRKSFTMPGGEQVPILDITAFQLADAEHCALEGRSPRLATFTHWDGHALIRLFLPHGSGDRAGHEPIEQERPAPGPGIQRGDNLARHPIGPPLGRDAIEHGFISRELDSAERPVRNRDHGAGIDVACRVGR